MFRQAKRLFDARKCTCGRFNDTPVKQKWITGEEVFVVSVTFRVVCTIYFGGYKAVEWLVNRK